MESIRICGVRIDGITLDEAVETALTHRGGVCTVFTPNALMLARCKEEPMLASLLNRATLSLPDGSGVLRAAKKQRTLLSERVAGIDFGAALLKQAETMQLKVFLLGGKQGIAETAASELQKRYPQLCICGTHHGYFDQTGGENERVLTSVRESGADILFVCFGFPLQEAWILQNAHLCPSVKIAAGLGGSLDVWAGKVCRAPVLVQKCRMEWAWRMLIEPRRMKDLPTLVRFYLAR